VGNGEIAQYEQFLLFQWCFQNSCNTDLYKQRLVWEMVKEVGIIYLPYIHVLPQTFNTFMFEKYN
jgi:hypothetical protein